MDRQSPQNHRNKNAANGFGYNRNTPQNSCFENAIFEANLLNQVNEILYKHEIQSVIIEGGSCTLQHYLDENLWDEIRLFKSKVVFKKGIKAPIFTKTAPTNRIKIGEDELLIFKNHD
jgi:diaminohydroxyphosphoribosylaminopyrimidine deaminase/5-amino-6-(5-phosphoribosylamino)uracil reductase